MKDKIKTTLVIDAGNTRIKAGVFTGSDLKEVFYFGNNDWKSLKSFLMEYQFDQSILSSVRSEKETNWLLQMMPNSIHFKNSGVLPINHRYATPETLGSDRLANIIGVSYLSDTANLILDIGTCIKFDLIDENACYLGGSISPGINLRYKSLQSFTGALPLVQEYSLPPILGNSTSSCIHSGVMQGIQTEINSFIATFTSQYKNLSIYVTGGDAHCFDIQSKNGIFVELNLTLIGLFHSIPIYAS
jgi:type III pantothenate kinase